MTRILGADWAERYPARFGHRTPRAPSMASPERSPCPVCGHPTGDCGHDERTDMTPPKKAAAKKAAPVADDLTGVPLTPGPETAETPPETPPAPAETAPAAPAAPAPAPAGLDPAAVRTEAFQAAPNTNLLTCVRTVNVGFTPGVGNTTKVSWVQAFVAGRTYPAAVVDRRLTDYAARAGARVAYA